MVGSGVLSQRGKGKKRQLCPCPSHEEISGTRSGNPLVLNPSTAWSVVNMTQRPLYLLERTPAPTEQEDGLEQESVRTL